MSEDAAHNYLQMSSSGDLTEVTLVSILMKVDDDGNDDDDDDDGDDDSSS